MQKKRVDLKKICELTEQYAKNQGHTHSYNELLMDNYMFCAQVISSLPGKKLLDVGTGHGVLAITAAEMGYEVTTIDKMAGFLKWPKLLEKKRFKRPLTFRRADVERDSLFWEERKFDVVLMTEVLEHLNFNPLPALQRLHRALNPNGHILITTPRKETQGSAPGKHGKLKSWRKIPIEGDWDLDEHTYHYSMVELVALIEEAGFETMAFGRCYQNMSNFILAKR